MFGWRAPPRTDLAEIIATRDPRLADIEVETVARGTGNWWDFTGRARLREDLWDDLNRYDLAEACGLPFHVLSPDLKAVTLVASKGTEVRFAFTSVVRRAEDGDEKVTTGGWSGVTWGGSVLLNDKPLYAHPLSFFSGKPIVLRTDADREVFCANLL